MKTCRMAILGTGQGRSRRYGLTFQGTKFRTIIVHMHAARAADHRFCLRLVIDTN